MTKNIITIRKKLIFQLKVTIGLFDVPCSYKQEREENQLFAIRKCCTPKKRFDFQKPYHDLL